MTLETERLILRPWTEDDAEDLYTYASSSDVGPVAGWPAHTSVENSRQIIRDVLSKPETYAVVLKETGQAVGSIGLMVGTASNLGIPDMETEVGFWIGVPFWGQGLIPEAVNEIIRYGFEDLQLEKVWAGYFDGNTKSKRVQEKCGLKYHHTKENVPCSMIDEVRTEHVTCLSKEEWQWKSLYEAARSVQNGRQVSEYIEAGGVAAAILSDSGEIYTGVCVDTACTLGICAERNAIFNMLTNGEQKIQKVIAVMPDGKCGAPCGACREFMVQLMPERYKGIEIMMDYETGRTIKLGEITPEWWV